MISKLRDLIITLKEEMKYQDNILASKKGLESSLWGLQEQANMPDNSAKEDQLEIKEEITKCIVKIKNCETILNNHNLKLKEYLKNIVV